MDATAFSLLSHPTDCKPTSSFLRETYVCSSPSVCFCKMLSSKLTKYVIPNHLTVSPSSRKNPARRAFQENDYIIHDSYDSERASRDRLVALFKRIRASISTDDSSDETSVVEFLQQPGWEKEKSTEPESDKQSIQSPPKTSKPTPISQPSSAKVTRPPSSFVKKSPITSPSSAPSRNSNHEVTDSETPRLKAHKESPEVEEMKLTQLKELAKERGIRGYSRLKKSELIECLRSNVSA